MREVKRHGAMSRVVLGLKCKRKKLLFKDGTSNNAEIKKEPGLLHGLFFLQHVLFGSLICVTFFIHQYFNQP